MVTALIILHVIICVLLTTVVLLQFGKGAEVGAVMGSSGASQAIFSSSGKGNFFTKLTTFLAIAFMVNSIALTTLTGNKSSESIFDNEAPVAPRLNMDETPKTDAAPTAPAPQTTEKTETKKP